MKYREPKVIKDKKVKKENQKQFWEVFFIEGGLFLLTSVLAVAGAFKLNRLAEAKIIYLPKTSLQDFLLSFLFITFFILVFVVYKKAGKLKELIYKGLFMVAVFWGGTVILNLVIPTFGAILVIGALIALWIKIPSIWVHDLLMVLGLAGAAGFFGLGFSPAVVIALLLIFSAYDFIAVYKTKHMILMAKDMIDKKVVLGFIIPKELKYFKDKLARVRPRGDFMILGGGDVVFPTLLAVSVVPSGFLKAGIIVLFSLIGLFFSYWIFTREKEPIPALPPVVLLAIIGYLITLLLP